MEILQIWLFKENTVMNGETYQLCSIVAATKRALKEDIVYSFEKTVMSIV